ncbi:MAG: ATP-binding protein [Spirochaetes bacterium]|nr:ATP-binding protein [Spirochaetota bacterium]
MVKRCILNKLQNEIHQPEINILLGPRQVGKTTLLKQLKTYAESLGKKAAFFDLEQPQILAQFNYSDIEIIEKIKQAGQVILIDEFQYINNASKILKAIFDSGSKLKIICSGSSSIEIHKHLKESLAGRKFIFLINPLEHSEIKAHNKNHSLNMYLRYGGMPGLTHTDSEDRKQQILDELLSSYILKDIKALIKEENIRAFNHLIYLLAERQGSTISVHSLANQISLSSKSVNRYLDILEGTYVNFRVYSFSNNLGNELKKSCKTYLYDLGLRNCILKDFSEVADRPDKGVLLESFVFLELKNMLMPNMEIKFWRTKQGDEVDFILLKNRKPIPIEVKSKLTDIEIPKGMRHFLNRYSSIETAYVINENISDNIHFNSCKIKFITFKALEEICW